MSPLEKFSKWVQLKVYQVEVTYSVYIFTPAEKFVFCESQRRSCPFSPPVPAVPSHLSRLLTTAGSVLFLLFSLTSIAATLYLPQHIAFILGRAWFYMHGDSVDVVELTKEAVHTLAGAALGTAATAAPSVSSATAAMVKEL
jgi:hypothetical protein